MENLKTVFDQEVSVNTNNIGTYEVNDLHNELLELY